MSETRQEMCKMYEGAMNRMAVQLATAMGYKTYGFVDLFQMVDAACTTLYVLTKDVNHARGVAVTLLPMAQHYDDPDADGKAAITQAKEWALADMGLPVTEIETPVVVPDDR